MEENIRLELFTVKDVRKWLSSSVEERGLTSELIAPQRAFAIVNNPYVTDDLNIISALFVNDEIGAYTYLFPDKVTFYPNTEKEETKLIYWNTTLYCNPKYEGRGYAYIVIGQFCELYGENYFDLDAAPASIENLKFAGLKVNFIDQYVLSNKSIKGNNIRSRLARLKEKITLSLKSKKGKLQQIISGSDYQLEYVNFIDDQLYEFIKSNSKGDLFLRSQECLNWILNYNFMQSCPIYKRVLDKCHFSSNRFSFNLYGVKVFKDDKLIGFYIIIDSQEVLSLIYYYYNREFINEVYNSVAEHILYFNRPRFFTSDFSLHKYLISFNLYSKHIVYNKSFAYPRNFNYNKASNIHLGDGDNIT